MEETEKKTVLLIVTDDIQRSIYKHVLETASYKVVAAGSLVDAVVLVSNITLDLIVVDSILPNTDIFSEMSSNALLKSAPVIVLANFGQEKMIQEAMTKGAADVIIKSEVTPNKFMQEIADFFAKHGGMGGRTYRLDVHTHRNDAIDLIRDFKLNVNFACPTCGTERLLEVLSQGNNRFLARFVCPTCEPKHSP